MHKNATTTQRTPPCTSLGKQSYHVGGLGPLHWPRPLAVHSPSTRRSHSPPDITLGAYVATSCRLKMARVFSCEDGQLDTRLYLTVLNVLLSCCCCCCCCCCYRCCCYRCCCYRCCCSRVVFVGDDVADYYCNH